MWLQFVSHQKRTLWWQGDAAPRRTAPSSSSAPSSCWWNLDKTHNFIQIIWILLCSSFSKRPHLIKRYPILSEYIKSHWLLLLIQNLFSSSHTAFESNWPWPRLLLKRSWTVEKDCNVPSWPAGGRKKWTFCTLMSCPNCEQSKKVISREKNHLKYAKN